MSVRRTGQLRSPGKDRPAGLLAYWLLAILILIGVIHSVLLFRLHQKLDALQPADPATRAATVEVQEESASRPPEHQERIPEQAAKQPARAAAVETAPAITETQPLESSVAKEPPSDWKPLPESARQGIRVQILNSVGVARLAARAADRLQKLRYDIREKGNAARSLDRTIIIQRGKDPAAAQRLAEDLGLGPAEIRYEADSRLVDVDLSLVLGRDYKQLKLFR